jgi:hypothetical protein
VDRHDRVVADADREMARMTAAALHRLRGLADALEGLDVELVVRFGRLSREVSIEAEVFGAHLVVLAAPARPRLRDHALAWYLGRVALPPGVPLGLLPTLPPAGRGAAREPVPLPTSGSSWAR